MNSLLLSLLVASAPVPVSVDGEGLLRFTRDGRTVYARSAALTVVRGRLAFRDAFVLPTIAVSDSFSVSRDGTVMVNGKSAGRLVLAKFAIGVALTESAGFLTSASRPALGYAGQEGFGWIAGSNSTVVASATVSSAQVVVHAESVVDSKTYTLADIADIRLPEAVKNQVGTVVIGDTPPIGIDRRVDRERIMVRLRVSGFDPTTFTIEVPDSAVVRRPSQRIEHERLIAAATASLRNLVGAQAQFSDLNPMPPLIVGLGDIALNAVNQTVNPGKASVRIEVLVNGQIATSRTVQLAISGAATLPKIGDMVTVRARSGGVRVAFTAKVTGVKGLGQIEVTTQEGEKLTGVIVEPGVVEINL